LIVLCIFANFRFSKGQTENRADFVENDETLFPLEFFVTGTPISQQGTAASKQRWRNEVEQAARRRRDELVELVWLEPEPLSVTIFYFPTAPMAGDVDNIVKPILDALIRVIYLDDQSIECIHVQKFEPEIDWAFTAPSSKLSEALDTAAGSEFATPVVYVKIENHLNWRTVS
jgi:crossover junction endodeoxyribonuclease RusA